MTWVAQRYRIILIVVGIAALLSLVAFIVSRQNINKSPSRGVFVIQNNLKETVWRFT